MQEVKERVCAALGEDREDWLEEACRILTAHREARDNRRRVDISTIGMRLRFSRECSSLSQKQVALRIQVNQRLVSAWERGLLDISIEMLSRLSILYRVAPEWLLMISEDGGPDTGKMKVRYVLNERKVGWRRTAEQYAKDMEKQRILNNLRKTKTSPTSSDSRQGSGST